MKTILPLLLFFCATLGGCANPGIVQIAPDTYRLARDDHAGVFGNRHRMAADVIREANAFAEKQGKVAIPISQNDKPVGVLGNWASFEYTFKLVDKNDPEAIKERPFTSSTHTVVEQKSNPDLYTELSKLDDLRKKGILTDAEFETQKKKLLESAK